MPAGLRNRIHAFFCPYGDRVKLHILHPSDSHSSDDEVVLSPLWRYAMARRVRRSTRTEHKKPSGFEFRILRNPKDLGPEFEKTEGLRVTEREHRMCEHGERPFLYPDPSYGLDSQSFDLSYLDQGVVWGLGYSETIPVRVFIVSFLSGSYQQKIEYDLPVGWIIPT